MGFSAPRDLGLVALCVAGSPSGVQVARVIEKPEVVGAAAIDLVVEQLQRGGGCAVRVDHRVLKELVERARGFSGDIGAHGLGLGGVEGQPEGSGRIGRELEPPAL